MTIEWRNVYGVGAKHKKVVIKEPIPKELDPVDAMVLAAYLIESAEWGTSVSFEKVCRIIENKGETC